MKESYLWFSHETMSSVQVKSGLNVIEKLMFLVHPCRFCSSTCYSHTYTVMGCTQWYKSSLVYGADMEVLVLCFQPFLCIKVLLFDCVHVFTTYGFRVLPELSLLF